MKKSINERFASKYQIDSKSGCWNWAGATNGNGRAAFSVEGKSLLAHRYSWEFTHGSISDSEEIRRECNNHLCVNPEHMYVFYKDAEKRFWGNVDTEGVSGHWYWTGKGPYKYNGNSYSPRNKAYEFLTSESLNKSTRLFALCGDEDCINPDHCGGQDDLFWSKVDKNSDGHWYWQGKILKSGYAHVSRDGKNEYVHRLAWVLSGNIITEGMILFHNCGVKHCVNPLHVEEITYSEMCRRRKPRGSGK